MGRLWCESMPLVKVAQGPDPKPVTLVIPYYENPDFLRQQLAWWQTYPAALRQHLSAIVVDDGSPVPAQLPETRPFPVRLFRIEVDIRWNWLAARNIGLHHASEGWCLVTDIDHVIPETTASSVVFGRHDSGVIYGFSRIEHTGAPLAPHPNSWFLTRQMFWTVGGYDEALSGHYGTDGDWRRRCAATAPMRILADRLVRHEHVGDSSTMRYLRKQPEDAAVKRLVAARGASWQPRTRSVPYHEVQAVPA